jgi:hypothetical protein
VDYSSKTKRQAAIGFVVCSLLTLGTIFIPHWQPRADFDVTGVLWLMQNILPLTFLSVFFALASGAGIAWLRCKRRESRR